MFRVEEYVEHETRVKAGVFFYPDSGGDIFLLNVG
jgi:hypothetical protein